MDGRGPNLLALAGAAAIAAAAPLTVQASNTGGVFSPVVNEGHRSVQYRVAYDPDSYDLAQRLHYQQAVDDDRMWRLLVQGRKTPAGDFDYDFLQGELFWQLDDLASGWAHGLRFDARIRDGGRPAQLGLNWMHEIDVAAGWQARLLLLSSVQLGAGAADGVFLETRASFGYSASPRYSVLLSMFSGYGTTSDFASFDEQTHQLGPTLTVSLAGGWQLLAGYLAGLTDRTPDHAVRLWVTRSY